jgi:hypothetical protein
MGEGNAFAHFILAHLCALPGCPPHQQGELQATPNKSV